MNNKLESLHLWTVNFELEIHDKFGFNMVSDSKYIMSKQTKINLAHRKKPD